MMPFFIRIYHSRTFIYRTAIAGFTYLPGDKFKILQGKSGQEIERHNGVGIGHLKSKIHAYILVRCEFTLLHAVNTPVSEIRIVCCVCDCLYTQQVMQI